MSKMTGIVTKTFEQLEQGDVIIVPGNPKCNWPDFREDHEQVVEFKYLDDKSVKVKGLGGVAVKMDEYKVKVEL